MYKRWRYLFLLALLVAGALGTLYESATHVGRGWLRGEAFYEGRPTSYWRVRCDEWLARFLDPNDALRYHPPMIALPIIDEELPIGAGDAIGVLQRPQTFWTRLHDRFRTPEELMHAEDWPPRILFGNPGTEPVLEELAREEKYEPLARKALKYAKIYRKMGFEK